MNANDTMEEAVEVLQQLGLKEYEARCFVGLTRLETGTAKKLSEMTEVPRTRVYDAIRVLEAQGLVEVQHSSPQRFRALSLDSATETLRNQYENRVQRLETALESVEAFDTDEESPALEVWSMSGRDAIAQRTTALIEDATEEVVLVIGDESLVTAELVDTLDALEDVDVILGAITGSVQDSLQAGVPEATTFVSGLEWLRGTETDDVAIGRLLMVDRSTLLVSSLVKEGGVEKAVFGEGFGNGFVVMARRLLSQGLLASRDPQT